MATRSVPTKFATIQAAVNGALPGDIIQVAAAYARAYVLTVDGNVLAGDQTGPDPIPLRGLTNIAAISSSWFQLIGLRRDGVVVADDGPATGISGVRAISAGNIPAASGS